MHIIKKKPTDPKLLNVGVKHPILLKIKCWNQSFLYQQWCHNACIMNCDWSLSHLSLQAMQIYFSYISIWQRSSLPELYNSGREVQCSHGLLFIDFSSSLSVYKRPPVKHTSPWPVRWATFPSFEQEPRTRFYSAWGHVERCDVSTRHSTASLGFPIVATIPALMSCRHGNDLHLSACFSFVLFLHSPTLIWH